jgi:hypothetical protein
MVAGATGRQGMLTPPRHLIPPPVFPWVCVISFVYLTCNSYLNFQTDYSSVSWPFHIAETVVTLTVLASWSCQNQNQKKFTSHSSDANSNAEAVLPYLRPKILTLHSNILNNQLRSPHPQQTSVHVIINILTSLVQVELQAQDHPIILSTCTYTAVYRSSHIFFYTLIVI